MTSTIQIVDCWLVSSLSICQAVSLHFRCFIRVSLVMQAASGYPSSLSVENPGNIFLSALNTLPHGYLFAHFPHEKVP